jgi:anti-anti-sigma factor
VTDGPTVPLEIETRRVAGDAFVIELAGELVVTNRASLRQAIERLLEAGSTVVVDATRLAYVDTPSLALLVQLADRSREVGGGLAMAGLPSAYRSLVQSLRLEEALPITDTVEAALARLRA